MSLTKACQQIFADLPRAGEQLTEDENTLNDRIVTSKIDPLATTINKLDDDLQTLAADLRKYGFGKNATGVAKVLRSTFLAVVQDSKGSSAEALSWLMLRSIVVKLNNDLEDADGALVLMKGLVELSSKVGASSEILTRLNEDKRAIERSQLEKHLLGYLKADRFGEALSAIENLLKITKVPKSEMRCRK